MPKASDPVRVLQRAACEYAWAARDRIYTMEGSKLEGYTDRQLRRAWDTLRKAAMRYQIGPRRTGRPRKDHAPHSRNH